MARIRRVGVLGMMFIAGGAMAIEEAAYTVVSKEGRFEVRDYAPQIVAEALVDGSREEAGNMAFRKLFRYISGYNSVTDKTAMTAPVGQEVASRKIPMTAPVLQTQGEMRWVVSFMMPSEYTLQTLPAPNDASVRLRAITARRMAAVRYSGRWTEARYDKFHAELGDWMRKHGLSATGTAVWARYNPPFTLPIFRRNEILIPIADSAINSETF